MSGTIYTFSIKESARNEALRNSKHAYAIVRSVSEVNRNYLRQLGLIHKPDLSPSSALFGDFFRKPTADWRKPDWFEKVYTPRFIKEMTMDSARSALFDIYDLWEKGEDVYLGCFCKTKEFENCHRSIVAGILQGAGCNVVTETGKDYSDYFRMWQEVDQGKQGESYGYEQTVQSEYMPRDYEAYKQQEGVYDTSDDLSKMPVAKTAPASVKNSNGQSNEIVPNRPKLPGE